MGVGEGKDCGVEEAVDANFSARLISPTTMPTDAVKNPIKATVTLNDPSITVFAI
ncbi:MAG: hypothetical protein OHK0047_09960 [Leptolyngbyaceae cyanobacterium]